MSLLSKRVLPLTLLGAAAVLGGCVGAAPLEGDDEQETQPGAADAIDPDAEEAVGAAQQAAIYSKYSKSWCYKHSSPHHPAGSVTISWGHKWWDGERACNNWLSACDNGGGCFALQTYWSNKDDGTWSG
ncbi:hypothetical protein [Sorangium sp. So ce887]|uniref:hypothetical protein n=1 Tax=Sorangium sp. So ce887 TaxID=3133324 RepID=UPI003F614962